MWYEGGEGWNIYIFIFVLICPIVKLGPGPSQWVGVPTAQRALAHLCYLATFEFSRKLDSLVRRLFHQGIKTATYPSNPPLSLLPMTPKAETILLIGVVNGGSFPFASNPVCLPMSVKTYLEYSLPCIMMHSDVRALIWMDLLGICNGDTCFFYFC